MLEISVSEVARRFGVRPRVIRDLFYQRELSDARCPIIGGRRIIPAEYLPVIERVLRKKGLIVGKAARTTNQREGTRR
jgi:hypothetical protein